MRKVILLLILVGLSMSCSKSHSTEAKAARIIGEWKLIEQLADPGDGSGTFQEVERQKILEFQPNQIITSKNGSLCQPYSDEQISSGTYSLADQEITTNCENPNISTIGFELESDYLILNFIANEGFSQKFERLK